MIEMPQGLSPQPYALAGGQPLLLFNDSATELVRLDLHYADAGYAAQPHRLVAACANAMVGEATASHSEQQLAEFLDYNGVVLDRSCNTTGATLTCYGLRRCYPQLLALLREMLTQYHLDADSLATLLARRHMELQQSQQQSSSVARNVFYHALFGADHVYGDYAVADDCRRVTFDDVERFARQHYTPARLQLLLSGHCDDALLAQVHATFDDLGCYVDTPPWHPAPVADAAPQRLSITLPHAAQTSLRLGRCIPYPWHSDAMAQLMVLSTALGGYFGSRLSRNIREDKGYTYGIGCRIHLMRDAAVFTIATDVRPDATQGALDEIYAELRRLADAPIADDELQVVRAIMEGDFLRSVDGIFERADRYATMTDALIDDRLSQRLLHTIAHVDAATLQALARDFMQPDAMTQVVVGPAD